jgi:hypothetical protein
MPSGYWHLGLGRDQKDDTISGCCEWEGGDSIQDMGSVLDTYLANNVSWYERYTWLQSVCQNRFRASVTYLIHFTWVIFSCPLFDAFFISSRPCAHWCFGPNRPGRLNETLLRKWNARGLYLNFGLPNGTSVNQEQDQLFGYGLCAPPLPRPAFPCCRLHAFPCCCLCSDRSNKEWEWSRKRFWKNGAPITN